MAAGEHAPQRGRVRLVDLLAVTGFHSPLALVAVALIVVAAAMVQSGLGMGFGLTAAPLLALIDPELVPAPTLILGLFTASIGAFRERQAVRWNEVALGSAGRVAGVAVAAALLSVVAGSGLFELIFGGFVGLAVLLSVAGMRMPFTAASLSAMSFLSGLMGTITSVGAPPLAIIYQDRPASEARPTLAAFFAFGCAISLAGLFLSGWAGARDVLLAALMFPPMLAGAAIATMLHGRFDKRYRPALLTVAGVAAVLLIIRGLT